MKKRYFSLSFVSIIIFYSLFAVAEKGICQTYSYCFTKNIDSLLVETKNQLKKASLANDTINQVDAALRLMGIYKAIGNVDSAKYYGYKALSLSENIQNSYYLILSNIELGELARSIYRSDSADLAIETALSYAYKNKEYSLLPYAYNRMAAIYLEKFFNVNVPADSSYLIKSLSYVDSSDLWSKKLALNTFNCSNLNIKGLVLFQLGDYNNAKDNLERAKDSGIVQKVYTELPYILINLYTVNKKFGHEKQAVEMLYQAKRLVDSLKYQEGQWFVYSNLYKHYFEKGDFEKALKYHFVVDSLETVARAKNSNRKMREFKVEVESLENKHQLDIKRRELKQQRSINTLLSVAILIFITLIILLLRFYRKIRQQNLAIKRLLSFQENFRNMIIHDIKNPLSQIFNLSNDILIRNAANRILHLVNNLLDVSKFQAGRFIVEPQWVETKTFLQEVRDQVQVLTSLKSLRLNLEFDCQEMLIDEDVMLRVFVNILTNAIKFSPPGKSIDVALMLDEATGLADVTITNYGPHISDEELPQIFELYTSGSKGEIPNFSSTGLGLSFCSMAIKAHGFDITVKNIDPQGVCFSFKCKARAKAYHTLNREIDYLTLEDIDFLRPHIQKLKNLSVNEASEIYEIINSVPKRNNRVTYWLHSLETSVFASNSLTFENLIKEIIQE